MRILIADDDQIARRMLARFLEEQGYAVDSADDGMDAWNQIQNQHYGFVITDWVMPHLSGPDLNRRIREKNDNRYVYTILLTVKSDKLDLLDGMRAGADDFVSKPFDRDELSVRIRAGERILEAERAVKEAHQALEQAHGRMKEDLKAAARIQQSLLPKPDLSTVGGQFAWQYTPCDELAGDILNVIPLLEHATGFYLLDVSGHGVPAALLAVALSRALTVSREGSSILREQSERSAEFRVCPPGEVLASINGGFQMEESGGKFFTMGYAVFDAQTSKIAYAAAGHPPAYKIAANGELLRLDSTGIAGGVLVDSSYDQHEVDMEPGDRFFIFSDGLHEADNGQCQFGFQRIEEHLRASPGRSMTDVLDALMHDACQWCRPGKLHDDLSLLMFEAADGQAKVSSLETSK